MDSDKRPFYQARLSVDEDDCWRPAVDEWDACYCASTITPRSGEALRVCFGDAIVIFNRNTHKNEIAIVWNISCRPGFFDVVIFRNGAAWKTMVSSGFVLRNTGPVNGAARDTFAAWLNTANPLQRQIMQIGWDAMSAEQRDAVRLAAVTQLLMEQRGLPQQAASDRSRAVLTQWHARSPVGPLPTDVLHRRRQPQSGGDEDYADAPPRRKRGSGVRPPPRKVLRAMLDVTVSAEGSPESAANTNAMLGAAYTGGDTTDDEGEGAPAQAGAATRRAPKGMHLLLNADDDDNNSVPSASLGPLVAAASEVSEGDTVAVSAPVAVPAEFEMERSLRATAAAWDGMRALVSALRSRLERSESENARLRAERDAAVVALQRSQLAMSASTVAGTGESTRSQGQTAVEQP
eukprot:m51a1_g358 hypothetical protein (405) ;mRNA; r:583712-585422